MGYIAIDLGTTNVKVCCYSADLSPLSSKGIKVKYDGTGGIVEFNPEDYLKLVLEALKESIADSYGGSREKHYITLTGQAESLVITDKDYNPLANAISWMDARSTRETELIEAHFPQKQRYEITGQSYVTETFPITKMLWLKSHRPELTGSGIRYLMIKDYIAYRLSGVVKGEYSIYNFTHYLDIRKKDYWGEILDFCGVSPSNLPELVEPCTELGTIIKEAADEINVSYDSIINCGTLDHFAGMIGTGNIMKGKVSESTGTVLAIAAIADSFKTDKGKIPCHYGPFPDSYVYLPVCESGGICLEWFRDKFAGNKTFKQLDDEASQRETDEKLIFLPYINGVNSPEFDRNASGVFYGINIEHDEVDFAAAVMEGVAFLLNKNINALKELDISPAEIITTGGGAKSDYWNQLKADITQIPVVIPENPEAALFGAAIIGAVTSGSIADYKQAAELIKVKKVFRPRENKVLNKKMELFDSLYEKLFVNI
jgi:xylulokinase